MTSLEKTTDISENMKKKLIDFSVDFCEGIPGSLVVISDIFHLLRCSNISENNERLANLLMEKLVEKKLNGSKLWELYKNKHNENIINTMSDILELNSIK